MASFFFAPDPLQSTFFIPGGAVPGNGAQVFIYSAGSTSKVTVYKDNAGATPWSNPIVLDSGGNLPNGGAVWIPSGTTIKAVWAPSNDLDPPNSPYRTIDNIAGINDTTGSQTEWVVGPTPTFVSGTQFTLVGDQTTNFKVSRRLKFTVTAGTVYGSITKSAFGALTTVDVAFDSGALDAGLSAVSYSVTSPTNSSISADYSGKYATTVPSSGTGTTNIWGIAGDYTHVTGTNNINHFSSAPYAGATRDVIFDNVLTLSHTSSGLGISTPTGASLITAANDRARVRADTTTYGVITQYQRANGSALVDATKAQQQSATTTGFPVTPNVAQHHPSAVKAWVNFSVNAAASTVAVQQQYNVSSVTWVAVGQYRVGFATPMTSGTYAPVAFCAHTSNSFPYISGGTTTVFGVSSCALAACNGANAAADAGTVSALFLGAQ